MTAVCSGLREQRLVLPSTDTLERIALKGRAAARRQAAANIFDTLSADHRTALQNLLINDPGISQSRFTWLRAYPHSTNPACMHALLARIRYLRDLNLPVDLCQEIYPARLIKFAREGAVALFERLTGQLFARSKNKQDQAWAVGKARVGRLMHSRSALRMPDRICKRQLRC